MKNRYQFLFILIILIFLPLISISADIESALGNFRWAMGSENLKEEFKGRKVFIFKKDNLDNKTIFLFIPLSNSYLYLFSISADKEFKLIFPVKFNDLIEDTYYYSLYEFNMNEIWPFMKNSCSETCAIISTEPLPEFEKLIIKYQKAKRINKVNFFSDILMYIDSLKSKKYLSGTKHTPWTSIPMPAESEIINGKDIKVVPEQFNYFFEVVFKYECE